jgi:hypothetical protein
MSTGLELLANLRTIFRRWEDRLAVIGEEEATARRLEGEWAIRDVVLHLRAWQQVSVARLQAALLDAEPYWPAWLEGTDPFFAEEHRDEFNARIRESCRDQPWRSVHRDWREGFLQLMELAGAIPEDTLTDAERYSWLKGYTLSDVLRGSWEHHQEHLQAISGPRA